MSDKYFTVNIRAYLDKDEPTYIGEESLYDLLSDFSCPKNPDVEYFLLHNAIEFTKKDQSITYLVFDAEDASTGWLFFTYNKTNLCPCFKYQQDNGKKTVPCQYFG